MAIKLEGVIQIVMIHAVSKMIFVPESVTGAVMSIMFITVVKSVAMLMIKSVTISMINSVNFSMIKSVTMSMIKVVRLSLRIIVSFIVAQRVAPIAMMTIEALRTMIKS